MPRDQVQLWEGSGTAARLTGSSCAACKLQFFPRGDRCKACGSDNVAAIDLAQTGTIKRHAVSGAIAVAEILLDDGVVVLGRIEPAQIVQPAMRVRFHPEGKVVRFVPYE